MLNNFELTFIYNIARCRKVFSSHIHFDGNQMRLNAKQYWRKNSRKHIKGTSSLRIIQLGFHWIATEIVANIEQCDISQLTSNTTETTRHCAHISCHHWTGIRSRIMIFHFHPFVTFSKLQEKFFMQSRDLIHIYSWNYFPI